jgi:hypothetical protein
MLRLSLSSRPAITFLLVAQIIPLLLFPPSIFSGTTQEWWFPGILTLLALIGIFELVIRKDMANWPWFLMSFSQGFNIISRLMMFMPHTTFNLNGKQLFNTSYVILTLVAMLLSVFYLVYTEWPEVRRGLI